MCRNPGVGVSRHRAEHGQWGGDAKGGRRTRPENGGRRGAQTCHS